MDIKKIINVLKKMNFTQRYTVIACALDKRGKRIAMRTNDYVCSHPLQKYFAEKVGKPEAIYLHAEIATLIACKQKQVHTLIIARINSKGEPVLAAPCPICQEAIKAFGVKEVIHT